MEPPAGGRRDWGINITITLAEGMEVIDEENGDLENLQIEL